MLTAQSHDLVGSLIKALYYTLYQPGYHNKSLFYFKNYLNSFFRYTTQYTHSLGAELIALSFNFNTFNL